MGLVHISEIDRNYVKRSDHLRRATSSRRRSSPSRRTARSTLPIKASRTRRRRATVGARIPISRQAEEVHAPDRGAPGRLQARRRTQAGSSAPRGELRVQDRPDRRRAARAGAVRPLQGRRPVRLRPSLVMRNHPLDAAGKPFPTLYWLTCPDAVSAVSRLESGGGDRRAERGDPADPELRLALEAATTSTRASAAATIRSRGPERGGVGGTRRGLKCLHAHYANHLAGGERPGRTVVRRARRARPPRRAGRVAAIDLGTNTIRLLLTKPEGGGHRDSPGHGDHADRRRAWTGPAGSSRGARSDDEVFETVRAARTGAACRTGPPSPRPAPCATLRTARPTSGSC